MWMAGWKIDTGVILVQSSHQLCISESHTYFDLFHVSDLWPVIFPNFSITHTRRSGKKRRQQRRKGKQAQSLVERTTVVPCVGRGLVPPPPHISKSMNAKVPYVKRRNKSTLPIRGFHNLEFNQARLIHWMLDAEPSNRRVYCTLARVYGCRLLTLLEQPEREIQGYRVHSPCP